MQAETDGNISLAQVRHPQPGSPDHFLSSRKIFEKVERF